MLRGLVTVAVVITSNFLAASRAEASLFDLLLSSPSTEASPNNLVTTLQEMEAEREYIQQMPLIERPNRPGHIYGNNVRRIYYGKFFLNRYRGVAGPLGF